MCHDIVGSGLIDIEIQLDQHSNILEIANEVLIWIDASTIASTNGYLL